MNSRIFHALRLMKVLQSLEKKIDLLWQPIQLIDINNLSFPFYTCIQYHSPSFYVHKGWICTLGTLHFLDCCKIESFEY